MKITFHPCGVGDFISIQTDTTNILIDSGFQGQFKHIVHPVLKSLEHVDLWILTHTDEDHIGGMIKLINSKNEDLLTEKVNQIWFNWSSLTVEDGSDEISIRQGILLRDTLAATGLLADVEITTSIDSETIKNVRIDILSPTKEKLELSKQEWERQESGMISARSDYYVPLESSIDKAFIEDGSVHNGGSIAFLLTAEGKRVLFLADAHPSVISESLKSEPFNCSVDNPLEVDCVKVAHHGSKANTSIELLELIECRDWVFCANNTKNGLPHKECLARIINHYKDNAKTTRLFMNHDQPTFDQIFRDDIKTDNFNFEIVHLQDGIYDL